MKFISSLIAAILSLTASSFGAEPIDLLKGGLSENWRGFKGEEVPLGWTLKEGVLTFKPMSKEEQAKVTGKKVGGDLVTRQTFEDFELEMEWKIAKGGNSGIFFRANEQFARIWHSSIEIQILDDDNFKPAGKNPKSVKESQKAGAIYDLYDANPKGSKPYGEWNHVKIRVVGRQLTVTQNGHLVADVDMDGEDFQKRFKASKFQRVAPKAGSFPSGFIGMQDHGGECSYRNMKVTKL